MRTVTIQYHHEAEGVWADSSDVDGFVVAGESLNEVRELVKEGLGFYLEGEDVDLFEEMAAQSVVEWRVQEGAQFIQPSNNVGVVTAHVERVTSSGMWNAPYRDQTASVHPARSTAIPA